MTFASSIIIWIVCWCHFDSTGTKIHINQHTIQNNWNFAINKRMFQFLSVIFLISFVVGVNGNGGVAQHCFNTCCGHNQLVVVAATNHFVSEFIQHTEWIGFVAVSRHFALHWFLNVDVLDFNVRNGCFQRATPVHQTISTINQTFFKKANKTFRDSSGEIVVHGERRAGPVKRRAQSTQLIVDLRAIHFFPLPHFLHKVGAAEVVTSLFAIVPHALLDHALCGNAGVISAWHPQHIITFHSTPSHQCVLNRIGQCVSQMQRSRHIWWWNNNDVFRTSIRLCCRREISLFLPPSIPCCFDSRWMIR
mmetsp:Transcript_14923/g.25629  ORF Transcript_14923/g.25629 Transcript_14923/m.25629 type:complete len:306 (-) Transcript_14923:342-1259(-)